MYYPKLIVWAVLVLLEPIRGYYLEYEDCLEPASVTRIDATSACTGQKPEQSEEEKVTLVQRITVRQTQGYRCTVRESRFRFFCGAFSHMKISKVPQIQHDIPVSPSWCRLMATQRTFTPPGTTQTFPLNIDQRTYIAVTLAGEITTGNNKIACTGEKFRTETGLQDDMLVVSEYVVLVESEDFNVMQDLIESTTRHLTLPCKTQESGCSTGSGTFIWQPLTGCSFERIQQFRGKQTLGTYLVDDERHILINTTGVTIAPAECGNSKLRSTGYPDLYIADTQDAADWPALSPGEFKVDLAERVREDYLAYNLETRMQSLQTQLQTSVCRQNTADQNGEPQRLTNGKYALRRGDLIYLMECAKKRGAIIERQACYEQIPLHDDIWINPISRLRTAHSIQVPCDKKFPITVRVDPTTWVAITPQLLPVPIPPQLHVNERMPGTHLDMSKGGAYTLAEADSWSRLLEFPRFHHALLKGVSIGSCVSAGVCPAGHTESDLVRYDLGPLTSIEPWNIWTRLDNWIRQYGDYAAALVLLLVFLRFIVNLVVLATAWLREGPAAVIAILWTLCCSSQQNLEKIRKKKQKLTRERMELVETEPLHRNQHTRPDITI